MIDSANLLKDLRAQLKLVQADLRARADDEVDRWGARLQEEYAEARRRERTGHSWVVWRDNEVDQGAVAWLIAMTFVRFCEDNDLLTGARINGATVPVGWIAGPGDRTARAEENLTAYFRENPTHNRRDWLRQAFMVLAAQSAGKALVDEAHNPVWIADISAERAAALVDFWRATDGRGELVHDFTDQALDTRFLGDLYQDLSDHARKTYALLQTPVFVEEFILDQTLTPALAEFGLDGIKLIDPTCGSGHFLLGAFQRLVGQWQAEAPALDAKDRVRRAMDSIHGVDLNPFAVAIARFRLTVAGLLSMGERSLVGVPDLGFHLAIGDSLLGELGGGIDVIPGVEGKQTTFAYDTEDLSEYVGILRPGQYHVVVGNPPYITVKDPALNLIYRSVYKTAFKEYQLTAPFMELFFRLAIRGGPLQGAGFVGQITGNGFLTQEFGKKVIEDLFGGHHVANPVDLTSVVDTAGAYLPGHGTPTVVVVGRRRRPTGDAVRVVIGTRGEPGTPSDPAAGLVWSDILASGLKPGYIGEFVTVIDVDRAVTTKFPWPLTDPARAAIMEQLAESSVGALKNRVDVFGYTGQTNADGAFLAPEAAFRRRSIEADLIREFVTGDDVRDYAIAPASAAIFPYRANSLVAIEREPALLKWMWPLRTSTWARAAFSKLTYRQEGRSWWEWHQVSLKRIGGRSISYSSMGTIQHFGLDRDGRVFNRHASFLRLADTATDDEHLALLGLLNSSTAGFWLKQVSHNKGDSTDSKGARVTGDPAFDTYEFTGTKLESLPLPPAFTSTRGRNLDALATLLIEDSPSKTIDAWVRQPIGRLRQYLEGAHHRSMHTLQRMIFEQEELDWETYKNFGLIDDVFDAVGTGVDVLRLGQRAFEISLARGVEAGKDQSSWFRRNGLVPTTQISGDWNAGYQTLVQARLNLMDSNPAIRTIERPEFKRRWSVAPWNTRVLQAIQCAILDRLEAPELWRDAQGPVVRSVSGLADALRGDEVLRELVEVLTGDVEAELSKVLSSLVPDEAVPYLAAHRYKPSALEKFRTWQHVWDLQRREDAGEKVDIPVPPKYSTPDFQKAEYWKARGKLDVPKERFILYPDLHREGDSSIVLGWAGWDHKDQALALAREFPTQDALGAANDLLTQMVAGLVELEPWVHQWHSEMDASFGVSPAQAITGVIDQQLGRLEATRDEVTAWTPPVATRGRRPKNS